MVLCRKVAAEVKWSAAEKQWLIGKGVCTERKLASLSGKRPAEGKRAWANPGSDLRVCAYSKPMRRQGTCTQSAAQPKIAH